MNSNITITRSASYLSTMIAPVRIDPITQDVTAQTRATAFFWEVAGQWHLITNVHVLTGWHEEGRRPLSASAFTPTHLNVDLSIDVAQTGGEHSIKKQIGRQIPLEVDGKPVWLEHPQHGPKVDVAVIPLWDTPSPEDLERLSARALLSVPVNRYEDWTETYRPSAADDAYVVGFPKGMTAKGFPIWKRASIASEPNVDIDDLPKLYVDTATREGMSGSPVIVVHRGYFSPSGKMDGDAIIGEIFNFLGVYSGRIGDDPLGVQLGIVWKRRVIDEIIGGSKRGNWPWHRSIAEGS